MADLAAGQRVRIKEQDGRRPQPPEKNVRGKTGVIRVGRDRFGQGQVIPGEPLRYQVQLYEVVLDDDHSIHWIGADWLEPL